MCNFLFAEDDFMLANDKYIGKDLVELDTYKGLQ